MSTNLVDRYIGAIKVADRFLTAKEFTDPRGLFEAYQMALEDLRKEVPLSLAEPRRRLIVGHYWQRVIRAGRALSEWVIQTRSIPAGKTKALELTARVFNAQRTSDVPGWFEKNQKALAFLTEAASWGEKDASAEGGLELAMVGPFKVHNTIGADAKQFKELQGLVESAAKALNTTRDFKKTLYGDVFVVGQIASSRYAAWYNIKGDDVYLRSMAKKGVDDLQSLIHELGHRYFKRFTTPVQRSMVHRLFSRLSYKSVEVEEPKVGDIFPLPIHGLKGKVITITSMEGNTVGISTGGSVKRDSMMQLLKQNARNSAHFPSSYASKDPEEFFSECFAFFTMGKLKPDLAESFQQCLDEALV